MNASKQKKTLLAVATSLLPTAATLLVRGQFLEGTILTAIAAFLLVGYDYLNDKTKGTPQLPEGIDEEFLVELSKLGADGLREVREKYIVNDDSK